MEQALLFQSHERKSVSKIPLRGNADALFEQGLMTESSDPDQALEFYKRALVIESTHVSAHINAGTLYYNSQDYKLAEKHYRAALVHDSEHALGHFNLANVLDETGRIKEAVEHYLIALHYMPDYADAHYNLALALQTQNPREALPHWKAYIKLDSAGPWANHARLSVRQILTADLLRVEATNSNPRRTQRRAKLSIVK